MPRTTNHGVNPHTHLLDDVEGIEELGGVETFTFSPGRSFGGGAPSKGNYYNDWSELYDAYSTSVAATPQKNRAIAFDPFGLPAGTPVVIPAIAGVAVQSFESQTVFTSAGNPSNRILVEVDPDVVMTILADSSDPGLNSVVSIRGLELARRAGAASPWATFPSGFKLKLEDASVSDKSAQGLFDVLDGDVDLELVDADMAQESAGIVRMRGVGRTLRLRTRGPSRVDRNTVQSDNDLGDLDSELSPETRPGPQDGLLLPASRALSAPSANSNNRPAFALTVLARGQLNLVGATNVPQVLQAFPFRMSGGVPVVGNTFSLTNGLLVTETYTFVVARAAPFEVTIGGSALATMANLAFAINTDSALWKSEVISIPGGGGKALAIIRVAQTKEGLSSGLADRAFGTIAAAASPSVGFYAEAGTGFVPLSYSRPSFQVLPAADGGEPFVGWSSVTLLPDKAFVTVIDDDLSGIYQVLNPFGVGSGSWKYIADAIDQTFTIPPGGGAFLGMRQTRFVLATLGAADVTAFGLPETFQPGEILSLFRTDATAGVLTIVPVSPDTDVNGVAGPFVVAPLAGGHGLMLQRDGTGGWWIVGQFP